MRATDVPWVDCSTVIATCDFHSSVPHGGSLLAALAGWRAAGAWLVDAGDFFGGNAFHEFSQGAVEERILADFYDAVVPGNHDLADLMRLREPERFPPVICCNVAPPSGFAGRWESGLVLSAARLRVGVVGFLGAQAFAAVPSAERVGFTFTAPSPVLLAAERDRLLSAGADVVIGVSHSGFQHDVDLQCSGASPFEFIIAGHCHSPFYHWSSSGRHVAKAPEIGAGLLRIDLAPDGVHSVAVEHYPLAEGPSGQVVDGLAGYERWGAEVLGVLPAAVADRAALARLTAERARLISGADAFVLNLPTLRSGLPVQVTRLALADAAPFDATLVRLPGEQDIDGVVTHARELGEEPVLACVAAGRTGTVATTSYLAGRLGVPADPVEPRTTVRGAITTLFGSHS